MWANVCYNGGFKTYPVVFFLKIPKKGMVLEKTYEIVNPNNMHVQYGFDKDRKRFCSSKKTDRLDYDLAQCMSTGLETFFVFEIDGNILEFHFNENNFEDDNQDIFGTGEMKNNLVGLLLSKKLKEGLDGTALKTSKK